MGVQMAGMFSIEVFSIEEIGAAMTLTGPPGGAAGIGI